MAATLRERIAEARHKLISAGFPPDEAALDAEVLARDVLGWDRATLLTLQTEPASPSFAFEFDAAIARRAAREPVAFITGHREFWGLDFEVTPDVLIPRPETELIVESALERRDPLEGGRILDVGTGSGCLAVALAVESPGARVFACDISGAALEVARRNARRLGVTDRVRFVRSDLLAGIRGPLDLVVSNPPYVPSGAELPPDVAGYEPVTALYGGVDGLDILRRLFGGVLEVIAPDGTFIVEFGFGQREQVVKLARAAGWGPIEVRADLQGIARVAVLRPRGLTPIRGV